METIASIASITIEEDDEVPSSVRKVVSNEDLLIEILIRLPIISLHLFRFVSKWWLSLITSPEFLMRRSQITNLDPTSGLFCRGANRSSDEYDFLPLDIRIPANSYRIHPSLAAGRFFEILDSCNGLLLCCGGSRLYVYNPSINNMFKKLPEDDRLVMYPGHSGGFLPGASKLAFDPTKSPYYKVVNAQFYNANADCLDIQIYSSQTNNWSLVCELLHEPTRDFELFYQGIYWNDAIHWLNRRKGKILHRKLDVEDQENPNVHTHVTSDDTHTLDCDYFRLFESRGSLLFVTMFETPVPKIDVYEMGNDNFGCSVKYCVTLDEGWRSTPTYYKHESFPVLSVILGERAEDSFLVMFLDGKVVRYNIGSRNVSTLTNHQYSGAPPTSFEFIPSLARV